MANNISSIIYRKATATYVTTMTTSLALAALYVFRDYESQSLYHMSAELIGWSLTYGMFIGVIILFYGNAVSLVIDWVRKGWSKERNWLALLLHGVFGSALYLLFPNWEYALLGACVALGYGGVDWWLTIRATKHKRNTSFIVIPIVVYAVSWGTLKYFEPPLPPYTIEDAVAQATMGKGTTTDVFPKKIGRWQGTIDGYQVELVTSAETIKEDAHIVTFTETWAKEGKTKSRFLSYYMKRGSLTLHDSDGETPPYRLRQ